MIRWDYNPDMQLHVTCYLHVPEGHFGLDGTIIQTCSYMLHAIYMYQRDTLD